MLLPHDDSFFLVLYVASIIDSNNKYETFVSFVFGCALFSECRHGAFNMTPRAIVAVYLRSAPTSYIHTYIVPSRARWKCVFVFRLPRIMDPFARNARSTNACWAAQHTHRRENPNGPHCAVGSAAVFLIDVVCSCYQWYNNRLIPHIMSMNQTNASGNTMNSLMGLMSTA